MQFEKLHSTGRFLAIPDDEQTLARNQATDQVFEAAGWLRIEIKSASEVFHTLDYAEAASASGKLVGTVCVGWS